VSVLEHGGLHVVENLRVVERTINRRKFNAVDLVELNSEFQREIKHGARWRENWRRAQAWLADKG
jgi:arginase family enzyme